MNAESLPRALEGIVGGDFNDPTNERIIYLSALGLAVVGLALLAGTILWWRRGRQEHPVLAPLEVMSRRSWFKAPEGDRRRRIDQVRLAGSEAGEDQPVRSEPLDLQALVRSTPQAFDDLREPGEEPVAEVDESAVADEAEGDEVVAAEPDEDIDVPEAAPDADADNVENVDDGEEAENVDEVDPAEAEVDPAEAEVEPSDEEPEAPVEVLATGSNDSLT